MNKLSQRICLIILILIAVISLLGWETRLPNPLFPKDYSTIVLDGDGEYLRVFLNSKEQWCFPLAKDKLPEKLIQSVILFEDKNFFSHRGVDIAAITRALWQNLKSKRIVSGGSTITMQVARLIKPKKRTVGNKLIEMVQALKLELHYRKDEILRLYLTHAPYGGNIIGYQAASLRYFGKSAQNLTWAEAATLAVLPNSPRLIHPTKNQDKLKEKRNRLLRRLFKKNIITQNTYQLSLLEPVPRRQIPFSLSAPHLTRKLKSQYEGGIIETTISKRIQDEMTNLVKNYAEQLKPQGIKNIALIVAETQTGEVRAYVASQDYRDDNNQGKVDGVLALRSTGSILKPFLYALSIDEGMILPDTQLPDIPAHYGSFSPANADLKYRGMVRVREALVKSLNVPAVKLLDDYGVENFYLFLQQAGMSTLFRSPQDYGLSLILGGAEGKLWDLASLYRGLANYGDFSGISVLKHDQEKEKRKQLISPGVSYLVLEILKTLKRPGSEYYWHQYKNQTPIAWKTGTSYGQRDGWSIGVNPQWTVAAWVGNFTGEGNVNLRGSKSAAPLMFGAFDSLPKNPYCSWFEKPEERMRKVELCSETGYLAGPHCSHVIQRETPWKARTIKKCPYHQTIFVNQAGTEEVCSLCWENSDKKRVTRLVYSVEVVQYLKQRGQEFQSVLPHRKTCPSVASKDNIDFIYPSKGSHIMIPRDVSGKQQKIPVKVAHNLKESKLFWYLDGKFLGVTHRKHTMFINFDSGQHIIHVVDQQGSSQEIEFYTQSRNSQTQS